MNNRQPPQQTAQRDLTESFSLLAIFDIVRRRKWLLAAPIVLTTGFALYQALNVNFRYEARVLLALQTPASGLTQWNPLTTVGGQFNRIQETLNRRSVLEPVIREFELFVQPDQPIDERELDYLRSAVRIEVEGARTFHFVYANADPEKAAQVLTRISERFIEEIAVREEDSAAARASVLETQAANAEQEMLSKYTEMESYKDRVNGPLAVNLGGYLATLGNINQRLDANKKTIADLDVQKATIESEINQLEQLMGYEPTDTSPVISTKRRQLEADLAAALEKYTERHPEVVRLQNEIAKLDDGSSARAATPSPSAAGPSSIQLRLINLRAQLTNVQTRLQNAYDDRAELLDTQTEYQDMADTIPAREQVLARLVREHEFARSRYSELIKMLDDARLQASLHPAGGPIAFTIAEEARVPVHPMNPQRRRRVYLGFALGAFIGIALVLLAHQLDTSFTDVQDLSEFAAMPILASIPTMAGRLFSRSKRTPLPTLTDRVSIPAEQFRILAVRLRDMLDREYSHVVLFTGSAGGEGKTTTVLNTAVALSQIQDERVLLVDADLRKPRIRQYLPDDTTGLGAEEGLRELAKNPDSVTPELFGRVGNLFVLAGTTGTNDSVDEIVAPEARKLIARLRKTFKYILIDSPPVLPMADSHLLAELADRVVFVVRARRTRRETLMRALEVFDPKNVLGLILNDVTYEHARYGPAYRHYKKHYLAKPRQVRARLRIL